MTKLAADIRDSPTVAELGEVGIEAMVKNIKTSLAEEIGAADLEQTVALKLASDPEAVAMMTQLGIDVDAAMGDNKDGIVTSIESLKTPLESVRDEIVALGEKTLSVEFVNMGSRGFFSYGSGGFIPGPVGSPQPIMGHGGELVLNQQQQQQLMFNLTVNSRAETSSVIQDFNMLKSMAGVA